jgi:hypothetical protein
MLRSVSRLSPWLVVVLFVTTAAGAPSSAMPPGYFVDSTELAAPALVASDQSDGDFTCVVRRSAPDSTAARLLAVAESCFPPRDRLIGIAAEKGYELGADTSGVALWWCDGPGIRRIPYAVTAAAVRHYREITEDLRAERRWPAESARPFTSAFQYQASIVRRVPRSIAGEAVQARWIATMRLTWTFDDGTFVPTVKAWRAVTLNDQGEILSIEGDGKATTSVALSPHRGIGRAGQRLR